MKRLMLWLLLAFGLMATAALVFGLLAIWTGDERWASTAALVGAVGGIGLFGVATYPGWSE